MGVVYQATDMESGRKVALKVLSTGIARDANMVDRFIQEGQLAAQISHPRTTFIYEAGEHHGQPFIAMELMPGKTLLDQLTEQGPMPSKHAVDLMIDVIDGLIAAHEIGVIHRDVKPSNCFLDVDGRAKIGDFGLSKNISSDANLTQSGSFMGTPLYAAPEQIRGDQVDKRTDVYAVGATLFALIAGRPPFEGDTLSVTAQIISDPAPTLRSLAVKVPRGLDNLIARALNKNPADRFDNLVQMREALVQFGSRGAGLSAIARRAAAYMIDYLLVTTVVYLVLVILGLTMSDVDFDKLDAGTIPNKLSTLIVFGIITSWIAVVVYFAVCEGIWGTTAGKRLMSQRVVNADGEAPGWRSLLRSFVIPGALGIPLIGILIRIITVDTTESYNVSFVVQLWTLSKLAELLPALICLLTMRPTNGFRGIHGLSSGTRVLRVEKRSASTRWSQSPQESLSVHQKLKPTTIGTYKITATVHGDGSPKVYRGLDENLGRKVWLFCYPADVNQTTFKPIDTGRPGRVRYLTSGRNQEFRWYAFECVDGIQFESASNIDKHFTWEQTRKAVLDYARELGASLNDGSTPSSLTLEQLWIDKNGNGKILEIPFFGGEPTLNQSDDRAAENAVNLMLDVFALVRRKQILPASIERIIAEFGGRPKSAATISWIAEQLDEASSKIASIRWDTRIGILGITIGIEWVVYTFLSSIALWFYYRHFGFLPIWKIVLPIGILSTGFFVIGFCVRGAPVFRFMGIDVRNKDGGAATPLMCGLRQLVCWFPLAVLIAFALLLAMILSHLWQQSTEPLQPQATEMANAVVVDFDKKYSESPAFLIVLFCIVIVSLLVIYLGPVYSIINPERGIPDRIVGTRLVPK